MIYGLVVTPAMRDSSITYVVFVAQDKPLLFISFERHPNFRMMSKEERKAYEKVMRSKELDFGDEIEFEAEDVHNGFIEDYRKIYPLYESRGKGEHLQIQTTCIFSPPDGRTGRQECYSELFGPVTVDDATANRFLSNVVLRCWISLSLSRVTSLVVSFGEFIGIEDEQSSVIHAPWNEDMDRFTFVAVPSDDESSEDENIQAIKSNPAEIIGEVGIKIGGRDVYCPRYADLPIQLVFMDPEKPLDCGSRIRFNAQYCDAIKKYAIGSFVRFSDRPHFLSVRQEDSSSTLIEVTVKWESDLPHGFFWTKDRELGIAHDPNQLLTPALLGPQAHSPFAVFVADAGLSCLSRFAVRALSMGTIERISEITCYEDLKDVIGVVLGNSMVLASNFVKLAVIFDSNSPEGWEKLPVGALIKMTAKCTETDSLRYSVVSWKVVSDPQFRPIKAIPTCDGYAFETRGIYFPEWKALRSEMFGFIEIPKNAPIKATKKTTVASIWVHEDFQKKRTRFVFHSMTEPDAVDLEVLPSRAELMEKAIQKKEKAKHALPCSKNCNARLLLQRCVNNGKILKAVAMAKNGAMYAAARYAVLPRLGFLTKDIFRCFASIESCDAQNADKTIRKIKVTTIPGDGVGVELIRAVYDVVRNTGIPLDFEEIYLSEIQQSLSHSVDEAVTSIKKNSNVALKGAILESTSATSDNGVYDINRALKKQLDLFASVVHIKSLEGIKTRHQEKLDFVIIREQTEGEYSSLEHQSVPGVVECLKIVTREKSRRIAQFAFDYSIRYHRKKVTAVHKANIMKLGDGLFLKECREISEMYPEIKFESMIIDNCCMQLVSRPEQFDVMIMPNLYGNIVTNLAAGLVGGAGVVTGRSVGADTMIFEPGARHAYYEALGRRIANPTAMLLCCADMLNHLCLTKHSAALRTAVQEVLIEGKVKTRDLGGYASTNDFADRVIDKFKL